MMTSSRSPQRTSSTSSTSSISDSIERVIDRLKTLTPFKILLYVYIASVIISIFNNNDIIRSIMAISKLSSNDNVNSISKNNVEENVKTKNVFVSIFSFIGNIVDKIKTWKYTLDNRNGPRNNVTIKKYKMTISILKDNYADGGLPLPFILIMTSILALMIIIVAGIIIRSKKASIKVTKVQSRTPSKPIVDDIHNIIPFSPPQSPTGKKPLSSPLPAISFRTPPSSPSLMLSPKSEYKQQFQYISKLSDSIFELENEKRTLTASLDQLSQESANYKNDCENLAQRIKALSDEKDKFQLLHARETTYLNKLMEHNRKLLEDKKSFENNEQLLLSTNEKLLVDKQILEEKILEMKKQLEITESSKKKALEELEEKNRTMNENKTLSPSVYDTEIALRAELANLPSSPSLLLSPKSEYKQQFQYISKLSDSIFELENEKRNLTTSLDQLSQESANYKNDCENLAQRIKALSDEKDKFQLLHARETTHLNKLMERNRELLEDKKSFENNEQLLLSTNEKLLVDKQILEEKILDMKKQLEITESSKKKALEELEEKNRTMNENKTLSPSVYDTEIALRAELANLITTKKALVTSIKSISTDNGDISYKGSTRGRISQRNSSGYSSYSNRSINTSIDEDDDDTSNFSQSHLLSLKEIADVKASSPAHNNHEAVKSESVLIKYIADSQKKPESRPLKQNSFNTFYNYDNNDGSSSSFSSSSKSYSKEIPSLEAPNSEVSLTPIRSSEYLLKSSVKATPSSNNTISPFPRISDKITYSPSSLKSSTPSSLKSSTPSSTLSSKKVSMISKKRDHINDRFIVPQSKLNLLLAPIQLSTTSTTTADRKYTNNSNSVKNGNYKNDNKRK